MNKTLSPSFVAVLSLAGVSISDYVQAQQPVKPNVIYIYADDMGKGMLSAYGQRHFTTPHIYVMVTGGLLSIMHTVVCCQLRQEPLLTGYHDCHPDKWMISKGGQFIPPTDNLSLIPALEKEIDDGDILLGKAIIIFLRYSRKPVM